MSLDIQTVNESMTLHAEFTAFQKTASSQREIENWFKTHPELYPNFTGIDLSKVTVSAYLGSTYLAEDESELIRPMEIRYTIPIDGILTTPEMSAIGVRGTFLYGAPKPTTVQFEIILNVREWPYMVAMDGYEQLTKECNGDPKYFELSRKIWDDTFPSASWNTLNTMQEAGLLPDNPSDFLEFIAHLAPRQAEPTVLPDSMSHNADFEKGDL